MKAPSACHSSQVLDRLCYSSQVSNGLIALRQISVTALFYLEDSRKIHLWGMRAWQPKDLKRREWRSAWERERGRERERERERESACTREREREKVVWLLLLYFFPPPGPAICKLCLAKSAACSIWSLHSGSRIFFCSIFAGFSLPCLLATAILDSFSLFYLPNILPSRDGRPNSLGIGTSRSFWLLPAKLWRQGVLGLPLLLVSSLSPYSGAHLIWYFSWSALLLYLCWTGTACCSLLTWAETKQVKQLTVHE